MVDRLLVPCAIVQVPVVFQLVLLRQVVAPRVYTLVVFNCEAKALGGCGAAQVLIFRVMVVGCFYSCLEAKVSLIVETGIVKPGAVVGERVAIYAPGIQLVDVSVVVAPLIGERYVVIVGKVVFCTYAVVVTEQLGRALFCVFYIVNITIVELVVGFLFGKLVVLAMTVKIHGVEGKLASVINGVVIIF